MKLPWLEPLFLITALAVGYFGGSHREPAPSQRATSQFAGPARPAAVPDYAAGPAHWGSIYRAAGFTRKAELLEAWLEQDSKALVTFLNGLPRSTVADHYQCLSRALERWADRDPEAAMQAAAGIGCDVTDALFHKLLEKDAVRAVKLTQFCGELNGLGNPPESAFEGKGEELCGVLAEQGNNLHGQVFRQFAAQAWASQDRQAAFAFILKQPPEIAQDFMEGFLDGLAPEESGQWVSRLTDPRAQSRAVWKHMITAGRADPLKSLAWATSLPPSAGDNGIACFFMNVFSRTTDDQLAGIGAALSEPGLIETKKQGGISDADMLRLAPHLSDNALAILRPQLTAEQRGNPDKLPDWIRKLPPEKQAVVLSTEP